MQENQIVLSPHVKRLVDENYSVIIDGQYILVDNIPYVSKVGEISRASIISPYQNINGNETFGDHTVWFTGNVPCNQNGESLAHILVVDTDAIVIAGKQVLCRFSYKSERSDMMSNIYNKLTHYIRKLQSYAQVIDPTVYATTDGTISVRQEQSVFFYPNTAISYGGLDANYEKLKLSKITIIGLGGTGSYILDALAKTPVMEIHLYDGDVIEPSNVFRMPGSLTMEEAHQKLYKTDYFRDIYSRMRVGIQSHTVRIDQENIHEIDDSSFVFIAVDHGPSRGIITRHLAEKGIPFIDVGLGVDKIADESKLIARIRVTSVDSSTISLIDNLPVSDDNVNEVYNNIQVTELNALNAMLAIITYKQKIGFYSEEKAVHSMRYILSWQQIIHNSME